MFALRLLTAATDGERHVRPHVHGAGRCWIPAAADDVGDYAAACLILTRVSGFDPKEMVT